MGPCNGARGNSLVIGIFLLGFDQSHPQAFTEEKQDEVSTSDSLKSVELQFQRQQEIQATFLKRLNFQIPRFMGIQGFPRIIFI